MDRLSRHVPSVAGARDGCDRSIVAGRKSHNGMFIIYIYIYIYIYIHRELSSANKNTLKNV